MFVYASNFSQLSFSSSLEIALNVPDVLFKPPTKKPQVTEQLKHVNRFEILDPLHKMIFEFI